MVENVLCIKVRRNSIPHSLPVCSFFSFDEHELNIVLLLLIIFCFFFLFCFFSLFAYWKFCVCIKREKTNARAQNMRKHRMTAFLVKKITTRVISCKLNTLHMDFHILLYFSISPYAYSALSCWVYIASEIRLQLISCI